MCVPKTCQWATLAPGTWEAQMECTQLPPPPDMDSLVTGPSIVLSMANGHLPSFFDPLSLWCVSNSLVPGVGSIKVEKIGNLLRSPRQADSTRHLKKDSAPRIWNLLGGMPGMVALGPWSIVCF